MFNSVNNPFSNRRIESSVSTGQDKRQKQQEKKEEEKSYLEEDESDEVKIGGGQFLTEDDVLYLMNEYINNLKSQHEGEEKVIQNLDKYLSKFDVKKFMKQNPNMTRSDFSMIVYNETSKLY